MKTFPFLALVTAAFAVVAVVAAETVSTPQAGPPPAADGAKLVQSPLTLGAPASLPARVSTHNAPAGMPALPGTAQTPPPFNSLTAMQAEFVRRFEASPGFGLSRVIRPVFLAPTPALVCNGTTYSVVPPELVALEDDPVVYAPHEHAAFSRGISTNVTRREVRKMFTHRPLTAIETNMVAALREGNDLVVVTNRIRETERVPSTTQHLSHGARTAPVDVEVPSFHTLQSVEYRPAGLKAEGGPIAPPSLLVFGALRAGKSCVACHQCEQGTLLGAFAYTLKPISTPEEHATNSTPSLANLVVGPRFP